MSIFSMPRLVIAGLCGGSGKTVVSAGLSRALTRRGYKVQTFKKGPDYIDTLWLGLAAGCKPRNLDPFMPGPGRLPDLFHRACAASSLMPDLALIEGNRGLFDGQDTAGSCSTTELARQLDAPLVLVMNCTKMTRTAAALVLGCKHFEPDLRFAGVVLNRVSRSRHRILVKEAVEALSCTPVIGLLPLWSGKEDLFTERYSGLLGEEAVLAGEEALARLDRAADFVEDHMDMEEILRIARSAPPLSITASTVSEDGGTGFRPRIGYVRDLAFWFYYTDNLEALEAAGSDLVELSLLDGRSWPELDGLYLGGGFPEDFAASLAENRVRREEIARLIEGGLPVYAEGTGFYYLARNIVVRGVSYPMSGALDISLTLSRIPRGIGYVQAVVEKANPFYPVGTVLRGHEFHYSDVGLPPELAAESLLRLDKGLGLFKRQGGQCRDGILVRNCFASHLQIFAPGAPSWASGFVRAARVYRKGCRP